MRFFQKLAEGVVVMSISHALAREAKWENEEIHIRSKYEDNEQASKIKEAKNTAINIMSMLGGVSLGSINIRRLDTSTKRGGQEVDDFFTRYYLILQSLPGATFTCGDETITVKTGELWWMKEPPQIVNNSPDDLIYMTVDIRVDL